MERHEFFYDPRRERAIERLRRVHGGSWLYERHAFGCYLQVNTGRRVYRCAALAPRFDGDDDSFERQLRWCDTGERAEWPCASSDPDTAPITASDGHGPEAVVPKNPAENAES